MDFKFSTMQTHYPDLNIEKVYQYYSFVVNEQEIKFWQPYVDLSAVDTGLQEHNDLFKKYVPQDTKLALDIGPNVGDSAMVLSTLVANDGKIICIEPNTDALPVLRLNILHNPTKHFEVHEFAASDANSEMMFQSNILNGALMTPLVPSNGVTGEYAVQALDTKQYLESFYGKEIDDIKFIKIDCEGYDFVILKNLAPIIINNKCPVVVEWWKDQQNSDSLFKTIDDINYYAKNAKGQCVASLDLNSDKYTQNIVLVPNE